MTRSMAASHRQALTGVLALSLSLAACADDSSVVSEGTPTGSGDTSPTSDSSSAGDGDGDSSTSTHTSTSGDGDGDPAGPELSWPLLDCDPLVPEHCAFPYPNNVYSTLDATSNTGRRVAFGGAIMPKAGGYEPDPSTFNASDGFSPSSTMLAFFPGGTETGLPTPLTIEASLEPDSPTVILNAETGERVPHWAEYDMSHDDDARRAFMLRPALHLDPDTRYIVAVRNIVDGEGAALPASPAFAALRDESESEEPSVEARRELYTNIFGLLDDAGIARESLQLAWDFSTASDENLTGRAVHIVETGLAMLPPEGPEYVVDNVILDPSPGIAMRIELSMTVPLFLDTPEAGGQLLLDEDGLPVANGTAQYPVLVQVPASAAQNPAHLMTYGHGMLGSRFEILAEHIENAATETNSITFATDWVGMAEDDVPNIVSFLTTGRADEFHTIPDRLQQGFLNAFVAMRLMQTRFADDPLMQGESGSMIDPVDPWYYGGSQGGIFGSCYMALSPDVTRGVLAVPGQPYSLLLNRSVNFSTYFGLIDPLYPDKLDLRFLIELFQLEWDRAEPAAFTRHLLDDPLPNSYEKEVLMLVSIGDHQVTTLGAHIMAREMGVPQIAPAARPDLFGIDLVEAPYMGSAMIEYEWGLPPEPIMNIPMSEGEDPHPKLAGVPNALLTVLNFLETGMVETYCDGICDPS